MLKSSLFISLFLLSVANGQFFYNYEEEGREEPDTQNIDPSAYQYNPPSTVNQQFAQPQRNDGEISTDTGRRRTRIRVRSRNSGLDPDNDNSQQPQPTPASEPEVDRREMRQQRRQARQRLFVEPPLSARVYSPSVFENIGLGEAPSGVYIPQDSFLNVLRNPSQSVSRQPVSYPVATVPETSNYVQPSVTYINSGPRETYFVTPPSDIPPSQTYFVQPPSSPRQTNLNPPVTRSQTELSGPSLTQPINTVRNNEVQSTRARAVGTNRQRVRLQPQYAAPPTVDIDSFREMTDDVTRENIMPQVQYVRPLPRSQNRRRILRNYQQTTPAPTVYPSSVFENVPLGEAPSGVYVPEDSLLNVLLNHDRSRNSRPYRPELKQLQPNYDVPVEYEPEVLEEEHLPPPPPPPRRPSQRSRQRPSSRRTQHQNKRQEQIVPQSAQPSSQGRNQNYEDVERVSVQHRTQSQRRPTTSVSAPAPRTQSQASSSDRGQRKAKLAIAELPLDTDDDGIPGEAGVNYPTLHVIPKTAFSCSQQPHNGYYADLETSCQVVHMCQSGGVQSSFLCPNGTIFSQEKFSCQWWYKVNCSEAPKFYVKNDELYKVPEKKERKRN